MRVIEILNKIANGEEVPKKIKYNDKIYYAKGNAIEGFVDYCSDEDEWCFNHYVRYENLNKEVEILEDKKIENITTFYDDTLEEYIAETRINGNKIKEHYGSLFEQMIIGKINEILDYLESKGE